MGGKRDWHVFYASVFFVLGFSVIFSLLGVILQGALASVSFDVQKWLGRIGGVLIIIFGIYLTGLIQIPWLDQEHKIRVKRKFGSIYLTSFVFGAAFAVGWTPCIGPVLGAILTLAATNPGSAFGLLLSYSLGLGIPFLLVGLFTNEAQRIITKYGKVLQYLRYVFGGMLILVGILVFTQQLTAVANFGFAAEFLTDLQFNGVILGKTLNIWIAFLAGIVSFLSPCVLPLIPAMLTYLASVGVKK